MWRQLEQDPAPEPLLAWIRKNVGSDHQSEPAFISALVGNLLRCINTKAGDNTEQEKELIITFKSVFQAFLGRDQAKQLCAIYDLQVTITKHCLLQTNGFLIQY